MSWSIYGLPVPEAGKTVSDSVTAFIEEQSESVRAQFQAEEVREQVHAAVTVVESLIDSGAVGSGPFIATLAGHANPGHEPQPGWVNDMVSISLTQAARS